MTIAGIILYLLGILGVAFVITETRIDIGGSFLSILLLMLWLMLTVGIGSALINLDNKNKNNKS